MLSSGRLVLIAKVFLKLLNLHMRIKQNGSSLATNLAVGTFGKLLIVFSKKYPIPSLFNGLEVLSSASDEEEEHLFVKNISKKTNLNDSGIYLLDFSSRTRQKLHNISVTPKMFKKVLTNLSS